MLERPKCPAMRTESGLTLKTRPQVCNRFVVSRGGAFKSLSFVALRLSMCECVRLSVYVCVCLFVFVSLTCCEDPSTLSSSHTAAREWNENKKKASRLFLYAGHASVKANQHITILYSKCVNNVISKENVRARGREGGDEREVVVFLFWDVYWCGRKSNLQGVNSAKSLPRSQWQQLCVLFVCRCKCSCECMCACVCVRARLFMCCHVADCRLISV